MNTNLEQRIRFSSLQCDPSFIISHRIGIEQAPDPYKIWQQKQDGCTKIVIDPWADRLNPATNGKAA